MKPRALSLFALLFASAALANPGQQVTPPMLVPVPLEGYNPYMMMPYGMPQAPMAFPQAPMTMPNPYMMPMAPGLPFALPMPQMPAQAFPQMAAQPSAQPAPQPAPPPDSLSAFGNALAQAAAPALTSLAAAAQTSVTSAAVNPPPPQAAPATANPYLPNLNFNPFLVLTNLYNPSKAYRPYEMRRFIEQPEKTAMIQMMLPFTTGLLNMGMPEAMNYFAYKVKAKPGLTFEDVRESLLLRANQTNMKFVGDNLMWKDFHAVLDDKSAPRIEVLSFCDIAVARDLLKLSPEFVVFLPCRIAIMEDADKNIWLLMVDWNMDWVKGYENKLGLTPELIKGADSINKRMIEMMKAAANGDL
ncbi:MAG: DUF302 domain-containing protein [Pseudomonadota bacterium]